MKHLILFALIPLCPGCTTLALERHTLSQGASPTDLRYQEVLNNLAMVAHNPYALPAYSSIFAGTAQITDTAQIVSSTTIGPKVAAQTLNPQYTRAVLGNWTLDPINSPEKLEAIRCCCQWAIYGEQFACHDCMGILLSSDQACARDPFEIRRYSGRHFGVADRIRNLPPGWVQRGRWCDVPVNACYKAHCGKTWVWVMPQDLKWLADFSLIIQDIARVDINSPTLQCIRPGPSDFTFPTSAHRDFPCAGGPVVSPGSGVIAEVSVDRCGSLVPDNAYYRWRVENMGSDANLRSQISAAAAGLH